MSSQSPICILGSHRSGSSAVTGLLALSGLELGQVIPPARDNPRGFFESVAVLNADKQALADMGRDWTCPPLRNDRQIDSSKFISAVDEISGHGGQWGFKDPRALFLLPHWAHHVPGFRFVGVYRPSAAIADSIERRNGFGSDDALAIARAYTHRLWRLHEELSFPIVRFDSERDAFLNRMQSLVGVLDLTWDSDAAEQFIGDTRLHPSEVGHDDADVYLAAQSDLPIEDVASVSSATVAAVHGRPNVATGPDTSLYVGPAHERRRRRLWDMAIERQDDVGHVFEVAQGTSQWKGTLPQSDPASVSRYQPQDVLDGPVGMDVQASHVIAPDLLDAIDAPDLALVLKNLDKSTTFDAVLALDGFLIDDTDVPSELFIPSADVMAFASSTPHLHHRDGLEAALLGTTWNLGHVQVDGRDGGRSTVVLVKNLERRDASMLTAFELRGQAVELLDSSERQDQLIRDLEDRSEKSEAEANWAISSIETARDGAQLHVQELKSEVLRLEDAQIRGESLRQEQEEALRDLKLEHDTTEKSLAEVSNRSLLTDKKLVATDKKLVATDKKLVATDKKLVATDKKYVRLKNRRIVRLSLRIASFFAPLFRWVRGTKKKSASARQNRAATTNPPISKVRPSRQRVERSILASRIDNGQDSGPLVSMVILTRNGRHHLERLFTKLQSGTAYRSFEVVVVDNDSDDASDELLKRDWGFPLIVVRNDYNASFSEGCNQGVAVSSGEYILLLNNDIEPINVGWLGSMVSTFESDIEVMAVGALLVYPEAPADAAALTIATELMVQHRGIAFKWRDGTPIGYNMGVGEDPTETSLSRQIDVPGVTAACMLVSKSMLDDLGGLDERFVYGSEDVDLNLRIRERGGRIILDGEAALFHYEFGTQSDHGGHRTRAYRAANTYEFAEKWGPRLSRTVQMDTFRPSDVEWRGHSERTVAITLTKDDPSGGWGDWHTAHELGEAFTGLGWDVVYAEAFQDHWYDLPENVDLIISLLDRYDASRAPEGVVTVAWIRNWTDRWLEQPWIGSFDILIPSSQRSAELIEEAGYRSGPILPLATNPERFYPEPHNAVYQSDLTFTGNHWSVHRSIVNELDVRPGERFSIFGKGWEEIDRVQRYRRGPVPYDDLVHVYSAAKIVLDDTAGPTLPYGAVNSRVFDALACGTLVVSNNTLGSNELFGGLLPTYDSRKDLRALLDEFLADDELRSTTAKQLRDIVLGEHTYEKRATQFLDAVVDHLLSPRVAIKIGPPNIEEAEKWGDTHFARSFASALEQQGFSTRIDILPDWDLLAAQSTDIVVHIRGLIPYVPRASHINVLWIVSHPDDVSYDECERYDLVLVASDTYAATLSEHVSVPVVPFLQATDASRFRPSDEPIKKDGALFVGNSRGVNRPAVAWSIERGIPLEVYGSGWDEFLAPGIVRGEHVTNENLPELYESAAVVLNDHWDDMREHGFISNRVFDVLACGGFIVSDAVRGIEDAFDGAVPTYTDGDELERIVSYFMSHPKRTRRLVKKGREIVLQHHTFEKRAQSFVELVRPELSARSAGVADASPVLADDTD